MKLIAVTLLATAGLAFAQPHIHERRHHHHPHPVKRVPDVVTHNVYLPTTVVVYVLNGQPISEADVEEGIRNGTLRFGDDGTISSSSSAAASSSASQAAVFAEAYSSSSSSSTPTPTPTPSSSSVAATSAAPSSAGSYTNTGGSGIDSDYDESLGCDEFPSAFGAVAVDYMGLGGWIGVQNPGYSGSDGYNNIVTLTSSTCSGSNCCGENMFCSYACPAGYEKTQWPSNQGVTGQSVGGLQCSGGKLKLTRGDVTKKLCDKGSDQVTVQVQNTMSQGVSVCRTDYPGTEAETVPVWAAAGGTVALACPDGASYYQKNGSPTSAQYYVNPAGIANDQACQWGDSSKPYGNYAPLNLGVGYSNGKGWISIFQNSPTTTAQLDFTVEIQGDNLSGTCRYQNGQYCSGENYDDCNSSAGCTVAVPSGGSATFVFS